MSKRMIQIVEVVWVDSEALADWTEMSEAKGNKLDEIVTVGLLMHSDKDMYLIASTYDGRSDSINAAIWIPRACVRNVRKVGFVAHEYEH